VLKDALIGGGGIDRKAEGRERGWDSWRGGSKASRQVGSRGSAVSSTPTALRFSTIFSTQGGISGHYNVVIVNLDYRAAIGQEQDTLTPPPCVHFW